MILLPARPNTQQNKTQNLTKPPAVVRPWRKNVAQPKAGTESKRTHNRNLGKEVSLKQVHRHIFGPAFAAFEGPRSGNTWSIPFLGIALGLQVRIIQSGFEVFILARLGQDLVARYVGTTRPLPSLKGFQRKDV